MPESFGARLRQQREQKEITLASISRETKINVSLLEALERDDFSHWPGGIFSRSFIRAYAQMIGFEPDAAVREFLELHPDPIEEIDVPELPLGEAPRDRPPIRLRYLVASTIASLTRTDSIAVERPAPVVQRRTEPDSPTATTLPLPLPEPPPPEPAPPQPGPDLSTAAHLCTELARAVNLGDMERLLESITTVVGADGVILWVWESQASALKPIAAFGYPDALLAKLPAVRRDAENATAAAFRLAQMQVVDGGELMTGAVVAPMLAPSGCIGALAVELRHGDEHREPVRALVTIFAAVLAACFASAPLAGAVNA